MFGDGRPAPGSGQTPEAGRAERLAGAEPPVGQWESLLDGLEWRRWEGDGQDPISLLAVRADPEVLDVEVVPLHARKPGEMLVSELLQGGAALAAINGGFFALDDQGVKHPLGLLIHSGKRTNDLRRADWGIFVIARGKPRIIHRRDPLPAGVSEALESGPRLLINGEAPSFEAAAAARRSAIGIDGAGRVVLAATQRGALTLPQLAAALRSLDCSSALNLDGGPSTQLSLRAGDVQADIPGLWAVPSAIRIRARR